MRSKNHNFQLDVSLEGKVSPVRENTSSKQQSTANTGRFITRFAKSWPGNIWTSLASDNYLLYPILSVPLVRSTEIQKDTTADKLNRFPAVSKAKAT
jgi:hypothetical protein